MRRALLVAVLVACKAGEAPAPAPSATAVGAASATPSASSEVTPVSPSVSIAIAPPPPASASAVPGPTATPPRASASASATTSARATAPPPVVPPSAGMHFDGSHFAIDVAAPAACAKDVECTFVVRLTAKDGLHVNDEYPYALTMDATPDVTFAAGGAFSKRAGDFKIDSRTTASMTVRYKSSALGAHAASGTYKLSVCSDSNCQIGTAKVAVTVAIK